MRRVKTSDRLRTKELEKQVGDTGVFMLILVSPTKRTSRLQEFDLTLAGHAFLYLKAPTRFTQNPSLHQKLNRRITKRNENMEAIQKTKKTGESVQAKGKLLVMRIKI